MTVTSRPVGITILAVVFIMLSILSLLWGVLVLGVVGDSTTLSTAFPNLSPEISKNFRVGLFAIVTAVVQFAVAIGLLKIKSWAWYLAIIATGLTIVQGVLGMSSGGISVTFFGFTGILVPAGILVYLMQPKIWYLYGVIKR